MYLGLLKLTERSIVFITIFLKIYGLKRPKAILDLLDLLRSCNRGKNALEELTSAVGNQLLLQILIR